MNTTPASTNRYMTILIAVLIAVLLVLALNVLVWLSLMNGGMMMGMGGMMNGMYTACQDMMRNIQTP